MSGHPWLTLAISGRLGALSGSLGAVSCHPWPSIDISGNQQPSARSHLPPEHRHPGRAHEHDGILDRRDTEPLEYIRWQEARRGHQKGSSEGVIRAFGAHHAALHAYARQPNGTCRARTRRWRRPPRTLGAPRSPRHLPNRVNACPYPSVAMHSPPCAIGIEDHQRRSGAITCEKMTIAISDYK
jgi:hypothetical protein